MHRSVTTKPVDLRFARRYADRLRCAAMEREGWLTGLRGDLLEAVLPDARVGDVSVIDSHGPALLAEVVGFQDERVLLMPLGRVQGIGPGVRVRHSHSVVPGSGIDTDGRTGNTRGAGTVAVGPELLGRVLDGLGQPIDHSPPPRAVELRHAITESLAPLDRSDKVEPISLGVRCLDVFVPCARGQRLGIFAGPGVGKSVLLAEIVRNARADVVVACLVGERGREVGHFVRDTIGDGCRARTVVVAATSDRPCTERLRAAYVATTIAEYFRDIGKNVLLVVDSLTRFAMAQREVGLASGEPPASRGYPPSTFTMLPRLVERPGAAKHGCITAMYTVLVEGDDMSEPIADAVRGLLDGHIILSRELAARGHYPAVDVLQSLSRLSGELWTQTQRTAAMTVRCWLSALDDAKDLLSMGAYRAGADPTLDTALQMREAIEGFLRQSPGEATNHGDAWRRLFELVGTRRPCRNSA